jgi:hypothetical protein
MPALHASIYRNGFGTHSELETSSEPHAVPQLHQPSFASTKPHPRSTTNSNPSSHPFLASKAFGVPRHSQQLAFLLSHSFHQEGKWHTDMSFGFRGRFIVEIAFSVGLLWLLAFHCSPVSLFLLRECESAHSTSTCLLCATFIYFTCARDVLIGAASVVLLVLIPTSLSDGCFDLPLDWSNGIRDPGISFLFACLDWVLACECGVYVLCALLHLFVYSIIG